LTPLLLRMLESNPKARPDMAEVTRALTSLHEEITAAARKAELPTTRMAGSAGEDVGPVTMINTRRIRRTRRTRSGRAVLVLTALGAVAALAIALVYFVPRIGAGSGNAGSPGSTGATGAGKTSTPATRPRTTASTTRLRSTSAQVPGPTGTASSTRPAPSTTPAASTKPTTASTTSPPPTTSVVTSSRSSGGTSASTSAQLARAITDYYALIPDQLDSGWSLLTSNYQSSHAGGFAAYKSFWSQFSSVGLSNVTGQPPDTVQADVAYHYKDGRTTVDHTSYRLVRVGGRWLISDSTP
jgi:hypothetical protein